MKRKTPKEILTASFQELAAVKSIDKITIQEIVDNCGYSPATFYRNFKDKYDLIAWEHTRAVAEIVELVETVANVIPVGEKTVSATLSVSAKTECQNQSCCK